jgi:hypothetical protein
LRRLLSSPILVPKSERHITFMCSTAGSVCGLQSLTACQVLEFCIAASRARYSTESRHRLKGFGSLALSLAALLPPSFPTSAIRAYCWYTRYRFLALCCLPHRTSMPTCFASLFRGCVWKAIPGESVVGPHSGISACFWRCAGVYRVPGVARRLCRKMSCAAKRVRATNLS